MTSKSVSSGQIFPMNPSLCFAPCYILRSVTQYRCSININWINEWMFCFIFQGSCRNQVKSGDKSNLPWNCHYIIHPAFLPYSKMIKAVGYERIWVCVCVGCLPSGSAVKNLPAMQEMQRCGLDPWVRKIPWRRKWSPTPVFLPGESMDRGAWWATVHGVTKESGTTEQLNNKMRGFL